MRQLPSRPATTSLPKKTASKLDSVTQEIESAKDPKARAKSAYESARKSDWFKPVIDALTAT